MIEKNTHYCESFCVGKSKMAVMLSETLKCLSLTEVVGSNPSGVGLTLWILFDLLVLSSSTNFFTKLFKSKPSFGSHLLGRLESHGADEVQLLVHNGRVLGDVLVSFNKTTNQTANQTTNLTALSKRITACSLTVV